ncbi:MAG: PilT/PilU family type 4a pilus ATPase [Actinobacteria bacterium]|nr:PilT/PilU family type 4a pilus ATPase [Actinomycetota bacterium]
MAHEILDRLLQSMDGTDASDLHIKVGASPRMRIHGTLITVQGEDRLSNEATEQMAAAIMRADVAEQFAKHNEADFAYAIAGVGRFRVNVFRQRGTVAMVFRRVRTSAASFEELGLPEVVSRLANEARGLVLVTGPTGSGKTTTLAAMIDHINRTREVHIVTIEDPIEVLHRDEMAEVNQREIGFDTEDFAIAMRSAMRQDPDVILVGEMRDTETVATALRAAETGHLVFSTLHTIDATETVNRIVDFFPPFQQNQIRVALAGALRGTICQRLVPRSNGGGRVAALEVMVVNGRLQQCIIDPNKTSDIHEIVADGEYYGMQTFDQALVRLYEQGAIDLRDAMMTASNPHDLKVMLQRKGLVAAGSR